MLIEALKTSIENKNLLECCYVFKVIKSTTKNKVHHDNSMFLAQQYVEEISHIKNKSVMYIPDLNMFKVVDIFGLNEFDNSFLYVCKLDKLTKADFDVVKNNSDLIIIVEEVEDDVDYVDFPSLEEWQLHDYVYSVGEGADSKDLDEFFKLFEKNIYRLDSELSKILIFSITERKFLLKQLFDEGQFSDVSTNNIFDFSDAITRKNKSALINLYKIIDSIDVEPLGLVTVLYRNYLNMLNVSTTKNPTVENTKLKSSGQLWAIKKLSELYTTSQLVTIFKFLCTLEMKLKTGVISEDMLIDYIVVKVLSI